MKLICTFLFFCIAGFAIAQSGLTWSSEIDVASNITGNLHPRITADANGNPLIIWGNFSTSEVYFSKWIDTAFTAPVALNPVSIPVFTTTIAGPDIASHGDTVYVVYKQMPQDSNHVFIQRSFDGGLNFSSPIQVENLVDSIAMFPVIITDSIGNPVIGYMKFYLGLVSPGYVVCRSYDFGNTFSPDKLASMYLGEDVDECSPGALICSGNRANMIYRDNFNDFRTIWCGISVDTCASFPYYMQLDLTSWYATICPASGPDGIIIGDTLYTVFMSGESGDALCYISASSLSTYATGPSKSLTDSVVGLTNQNYPRISNFGNKTGIVCRQTYNGNGQLAFFYANDITNGISDIYDTLGYGNISNGDVCVTKYGVHVIWQDDNSETVKYRKAIFSTVSVDDFESSLKNLSVYPSPSDGNFLVKLKNDNTAISKIEIFDACGKSIPVTFSKSGSIVYCNLNNAKAGIYFVKVTDTGLSTLYSKMVVGY